MKVIYVIFNLQCLTFLFSFLFGIKILRKEGIDKLIKFFTWYTVIAFCFALPIFIENNFSTKLGISVTLLNISLLFHYYLIVRFIQRIIYEDRINLKAEILFWVYLVLLLAYIFQSDVTVMNYPAYTITNFVIIVYCCMYYFDLFKKSPVLELLNDSKFWIISGIFISMSVCIPTMGLTLYSKSRGLTLNFKRLYSVTNLAYLTMHLFIIKGYICAFRKVRD